MIVLLKRFVAPWLSQHQLTTVARQLSGYGIGGLASFWLLERCAGFM
jgi:hypothetical protein